MGGSSLPAPMLMLFVLAIFVVVVDTDAALTLTVGIVARNPAWMSLPGPIEYLAPKAKHKGATEGENKADSRVGAYRFKKYSRCWDICRIRIQNGPVLWHSTTATTSR